jgi:hypothetical protein
MGARLARRASRTLCGGLLRDVTSHRQRAQRLRLQGEARGRAVGSSDDSVAKATLPVEEVEDHGASVINPRCRVRSPELEGRLWGSQA